MTLLFISTLWVLTVCDIHFCIWKLSKFIFMGSPLRSILVCKIPEFWKWKLWDQNFVRFDSGNIHIRGSKKPGFTFDNQICLISLSILFCHCLLLFLFWFRVLFLNSLFLNFPLFIIIRCLQTIGSLLKIIRCFLSTVEKFHCIAFQIQVLIGTQTISCYEISQENVHGWAEFELRIFQFNIYYCRLICYY